MATEPITIIITSGLELDGQTPLNISRDDFQNGPNSRLYTISVPGPFGVVSSDFSGLIKGERPKLVGISASSSNPYSVARVVPSIDDPESFRREVNLVPEMQYVMMYANDSLAIVTRDGGRAPKITLVVNELSEAEHINYAIAKPPAGNWRRFRIIRDDATGFQLGLNADAWRPNFLFDASSNVMVAREIDKGPIPLSSFCTSPRYAGCLIRVRYANIETTGNVRLVDAVTRSSRAIGQVDNMEWSKVIAVSHDDHIALRSSDAPGGAGQVVVDLMVARVNSEDLLQGRFDSGQ